MPEHRATTPLKLRRATPRDADILTSVMHRAKASWGYSDHIMVQYRREMCVTPGQVTDSHVLVAEQDGDILGFAAATREPGDTMFLSHLYIEPRAQRQGIGDLLLSRMEDHARRSGLTWTRLESDPHATPFYRARGFTSHASRPSSMAHGKRIELMQKPIERSIFRIESIELRVTDNDWAFEHAHQEAIERHFAELHRKNPHLWNGRTMKLIDYRFDRGAFFGTCAPCSYAAHLAWRDWGAPDQKAYNLFGSAVLQSADGALLYGVMAPTTATAGLIYPPGGNLDPSDLTADGRIDINSSIRREMEEETGLTTEDVREGELMVAFDGPRISIARLFKVDQTAVELRERILKHSLSTEEKELSDIRILRRPEDLADPAIVSYAREIAETLFSSKANGTAD